MKAGSIKRIECASDADLREAHRECSSIVKQNAGNFYYAFIALSAGKRTAMEALYAFCRAGDDSVDGDVAFPVTKLQNLHEKLDLCYRGEYKDNLTLAFTDAIRRFGFERERFEEMFLGFQEDLSVKHYATFEDLRLYCYRVAVTVGLHCLKIFDADSPETRRYADSLGTGMQLTNILRDLKEDYDRGRVYIPSEDLDRFGLRKDNLFTPGNKRKLKRMMDWQIERTMSFFRQAEEQIPVRYRGNLTVARIMGAIYLRLLEKLSAQNTYEERTELSTAEKIGLAAQFVSNNSETFLKISSAR